MAKKEKKENEGPAQTWLVTFGDLVTLLLTFFVLLLTMASMDKSVISRVSLFARDAGIMTYKGSGKIPIRIQLIQELLERPEDLLLERNRIKDLLLPDELLPEGIDRQTVAENLEILRKPEGVALVLSDKLMFTSGQTALSPGAKALLDQVALMLQYIPAPVNIAGFTDNVGGNAASNYVLAGERAISVLDYLLSRGIEKERFSISAYGPNLAMVKNDTPQGRAKNRRVEILLKTDRLIGSYS